MPDEEEELWKACVRGTSPFLPQQALQNKVPRRLQEGKTEAGNKLSNTKQVSVQLLTAGVWQRRTTLRQQLRAAEDDLWLPSNEVREDHRR